MNHSSNRIHGNTPHAIVMSGTARNVADTTPPVLVSGPLSGHDPSAKLVFTFNEPVKLGSGKVTLSGNGQVLEFDVPGNFLTVDGNTVSFDPPGDLGGKAFYGVTFSAGAILDLSGNAIVDPVNPGSGLAVPFSTGISSVPVNVTGTSGADRIHGSELADTISGGAGNDTLYGYGGDDILSGGDEPVRPGVYGDALYGGDGNDILNGNGGSDQLYGEGGNDKLYGGADRDYLNGGGGDDLLEGGDGDDSLYDDAGANIMRGGEGNDFLSSQLGASGTLEGGNGNDTLVGRGSVSFDGGAGDDTIRIILEGSDATTGTAEGGTGNDRFEFFWRQPADARLVVRGGSGTDTYAFQEHDIAADAAVVVHIGDFTPGANGDRIDLLTLLGDSYASNPFADGFLRLAASGADTLLQMRAAGAPGGYHTLLTLAGIAPASLVRENFVGAIDPSGQIEGLVLDGTDSSDVLTGTAMGDTLRGLGGADRLVGGAGNDLLVGGAGNDALDGGEGIDRAQYSGLRSDYTMTRTQGGVTLTDKRGASGEGADTLAGIERLAFADGHLALDIDGVAGQAFRIYRAAFDRAPDLVGQGFWMAMMERGVSAHAVANGFIASEEFTKLYGASPTNAEIVTRLYQNVLHREPEPGGYAFWLDILDTKKTDLATVLLAFSNGTENTANVAELIANGIAYTPFG
ncbi:DUF4214 domain-containing protein [Massilia sp. BKSP1R2A-1]|uniref:DUF4214 domain-containing protein n=1 Tax=Massilia sp. BKSP1R2A-1 TaxID=3422595 RepID=UPI003D33B78E